MNKFRVSLTDRGGELHGKVDVTGQYAFVKEAALATVEALAKSFGMTSRDLLIDLYRTEEKLRDPERTLATPSTKDCGGAHHASAAPE